MSSSLKQTFTGTLLDHKKGNWTGLRHKGKPQTRFTTKHDALRSGSELHFHRNFHQSNTYPAQAGYSRKTRMLRVLLCLLLAHLRTPVSSMSLTQPRISLSSSSECPLEPEVPPNSQRAGVNMGPQSLEVTKGHSFSMSCSTDPQYPGGFFQLLFSGSNTRNGSAVNHSACFPFPEADYSHQGNYSCVYRLNHTFVSDQTEPVVVIVKAPWLLILIAASGSVLPFILLLSIFVIWRRCLGNRHRKSSINEDAMNPDGEVRYATNEPVEDDERDYESLDDEDTGDYVNTATLGGSEENLDEEEDYVNTATLGDGEDDYECTENYSEHSDGDDYVNVDPLGAGTF
ncbi:uncharacterized protein LOC116223204 isoform X2 [Clupea harengus]|uniref:Uncharacterized protein LOC116223204 isoform X2 n=1 Tax=Clupea harengus TaxID=7950 RepID=A0A6P8GJB6_CLUHA|nr:uncharacterized protein LOC116223204 isoform X2 [Clupea harengus]